MKYTHKTSDGSLARVICDDIVGGRNCAVAILVGGAEIVRTFHKDSYGSIRNTDETLKEISPWDDVAVDTPIWVKHRADWPWHKMHFAEYKCGEVRAWSDGKTSHTIDDVTMDYDEWSFATLENPNGN